jgi:hypothetical protein
MRPSLALREVFERVSLWGPTVSWQSVFGGKGLGGWGMGRVSLEATLRVASQKASHTASKLLSWTTRQHLEE